MIRQQEIYEVLGETIKNVYYKVHAICDPDGGEEFGDCFCAAVDLFQQGMTFRVYFKRTSSGEIRVQHLERWFLG